MTTLAGSPTVQGIDDAHEMVAAPILAAVFGPAVAEPEALHVQAKRCLAGGVRACFGSGLAIWFPSCCLYQEKA